MLFDLITFQLYLSSTCISELIRVLERMEYMAQNTHYVEDIKDLFEFSGSLQNLLQFNTTLTQSVKSELIDVEILDEIKHITNYENTAVYFDDRTWLHVEVTPEGVATNIHLIGQSMHWHNKLQSGLLNWDHDKSIVDNIMITFDLFQFPQPTFKHGAPLGMDTEDTMENPIVCGICLCTELPGSPGVPQPLCQNISCGVYYHRTCLYQWLVACSGSRPPAFGVANGSCPTCLQSIACSEKDN
ncbi:uncharacterized protein LOC111358767 isoform X2 [Spodoptera litura]|uniref:Uncharacterized protein LOC111358767 isoform X2 n=1 Tax=Spodoptera litura TaxID=69820 RepID=A0A9J7IVF1_SPOLT|nr:uncharacterized protein LOC111358767 isoform X2 [Spodoptera litura]